MAKFCPWFPALTCNVFWGRSCSVINWTLLTLLHASNDLPSLDIFMCGVATLLQLKRRPLTGIGLPVVLGCAVQAVTPLETIGGKLGITYMYGAIIAAGIFVFLIAGFFARLKKFFPPVVTGSLITIIGFTLVPVGFQDLGGGTPTAASFGDPANLLIGFLTIAIILLFNAFARGFMKSIAISLRAH